MTNNQPVSMPNHPKQSVAPLVGIPVDAPKAVELMSKLIGKIPMPLLYPGSEASASSQLSSAQGLLSDKLSMTGDDDLKKLSAQIAQAAKQVKMLESTIDLLVRNSLSVTVDKPNLERILDQDGVAGLRFYLCISGNAADPEDILSLVVVGVDGKNFDHKYTFDIDIKKEIHRIPTQSFVAEYNLTSGPVDFYNLEESNHQLQPYMLLRYALNASQRPAAKKP